VVQYLSVFQLSRNRLAIYAQSIANILLIAWLYNEYVHNVFMQQYLSNMWAASGNMIAIIVLIATAGIAGLVFYARQLRVSPSIDSEKSRQENSQTSMLTPIDACPVCNSSLRSLSASRVQCRKCKRYFKK